MNSRDIVRLLTDTSNLSAGKAKNKLGDRASRRRNGTTAKQASFLEDFIDLRRSQHKDNPHPYQRPVPGAAPNGTLSRRRQPGPLTDVELVWLSRLPTDPQKVTFRDAVQLAEIAASVPTAKYRDHAILVDSIWGPVKEFHDREAAKAALDRVRATPSAIPDSAVGALADALADELPQLTDGERSARARGMVEEAKDNIVRSIEASIAKAEVDLSAADVRASQRASLSAPTG